MLGEGIHGLDFAFVAGKFATPFWQWWDVLMLWLALIHGANGMRTIVNDYVTHEGTRRMLVVGAVAVRRASSSSSARSWSSRSTRAIGIETSTTDWLIEMCAAQRAHHDHRRNRQDAENEGIPQ